MSKTKFTPGPWEWREDQLSEGHSCCVFGANGFRIGSSRGDMDHLSATDAALIAAAPDLYEALGKCESAIRALWSNMAEFGAVTDVEFFDAVWSAEDAARAALAKARGRHDPPL